MGDGAGGVTEAEPGWEVVAPAPFSLVCFRFTGNGKEIFIGTLKAFGVIFGMALLLGLVQFAAIQAGMPLIGTR